MISVALAASSFIVPPTLVTHAVPTTHAVASIASNNAMDLNGGLAVLAFAGLCSVQSVAASLIYTIDVSDAAADWTEHSTAGPASSRTTGPIMSASSSTRATSPRSTSPRARRPTYVASDANDMPKVWPTGLTGEPTCFPIDFDDCETCEYSEEWSDYYGEPIWLCSS